MNYYIVEGRDDGFIRRNAGGKAKNDISDIFGSLCMKPLNIPGDKPANLYQKVVKLCKARSRWRKAFCTLKKGDNLFIQFPVKNASFFLPKYLRILKENEIKIYILIHDIVFLRSHGDNRTPFRTKLLSYICEKGSYKVSDGIIVHNNRMKQSLQMIDGIDEEKMVSLNIFDYLCSNDKNTIKKVLVSEKNFPIIIAGSLDAHKANYLNYLPENCEFNLYGNGYESIGKKNVHYKGSYTPDDIVEEISGSFGLVWDGDSPDTCSGFSGEYLKINNPHKTSLYLAAGIPIIVWREAAVSDFVLENRCGITIDSLYDIREKIDMLTEEEYKELCKAANVIGEKLRKGYYTRQAAEKLLKGIGKNEVTRSKA